MSSATRLVDERHDEIEACLAELDLALVRQRFALLMDAAMAAARSQRLDHDDVIFERLIWMRAEGDDSPQAVAGLPLADKSGWFEAFSRARAPAGLPAAKESAVRVERLTLRTLVEIDAPLWEGARPDRNLPGD